MKNINFEEAEIDQYEVFVDEIRFDDRFTFQDLYSFLDHQVLDKLYDSLNSFIEKEIQTSNNFIKNIEENERDLVNLI